MQKWLVLKEKHIRQSQECTFYVSTGLNDEYKIIKTQLVISDERSIMFLAAILVGWTERSKPRTYISLITNRFLAILHSSNKMTCATSSEGFLVLIGFIFVTSLHRCEMVR